MTRRVLTEARTTDAVVVVGASTGGTKALRALLGGFGAASPAVAVVLHMPAGFTASFAGRLNEVLGVSVREARTNDALLPGHVLIAPGDRHMLVRRIGGRAFVEVRDSPQVNRHRPAVDVLFDSAAQHFGRNAVGVILTGMGDDGARGLLRMRVAGATTFGQDEASCVVYGMPREAMRLGSVCRELPLARLARAIHESAVRPADLPRTCRHA